MIEPESSSNIIVCDICDKPVVYEDQCNLYLQGIADKLRCHSSCVDIFLKAKGDFSKLPNGRLKRAISKEEAGSILLCNTGITIRAKQGKSIIEGLRISKDEGYDRIQRMAIDFYGLPKPNEDEFYSVDHNKQIVLMKKVDEPYEIKEVNREDLI